MPRVHSKSSVPNSLEFAQPAAAARRLRAGDDREQLARPFADMSNQSDSDLLSSLVGRSLLSALQPPPAANVKTVPPLHNLPCCSHPSHLPTTPYPRVRGVAWGRYCVLSTRTLLPCRHDGLSHAYSLVAHVFCNFHPPSTPAHRPCSPL